MKCRPLVAALFCAMGIITALVSKHPLARRAFVPALSRPITTWPNPAVMTRAAGIRPLAMATDFAKLTVLEIKSLLRTKGLPVSGLKAELVERLQQSDSAASTSAAAPRRSIDDDDGESSDWDSRGVAAAGTSRALLSSPPTSSSALLTTRAERRAAMFGSMMEFPKDRPSVKAELAERLSVPASVQPSSGQPTFLDFDDSVFDVAQKAARGQQRMEDRTRAEWTRDRRAPNAFPPRRSDSKPPLAGTVCHFMLILACR